MGDEITVTLTLTNNETVDVEGIRVDALEVSPNELLNPVSGPTTEAGTDPRVNPISLSAGATTTVSWVYKANAVGRGTLTANVSGQNPYTPGVFFSSAEDNVAIESAAIVIKDLSLRPGRPVPGAFVTVRGSIENIGTVDINNIDFSLTTNNAAKGPMFDVFSYRLDRLDTKISPRISSLPAGETHEFLIPLSIATDVGELATYRINLSMQGTANIDGIDVEIKDTAVVAGGLDTSVYWTSILAEVRSYLFNGLLDNVQSVIDAADRLGKSGLFGGTVVGSSKGTLNAFQKMGDGILGIPDLIAETGSTLGYTAGFTNDGKAVVSAIREYVNTTSTKEMLVDMANVEELAALKLGDQAVGVAETMNKWMFSIDKATAAGDYQKAAELITEPAVSVALSVGSDLAVEKAGAWLMKKIMNDSTTRKFMRGKRRAPEVPTETMAEAEVRKIQQSAAESFDELPDGVPLRADSVEQSGVAPSELASMKIAAKENDAVFVVRPESEQLAGRAKLNKAPVSIKKKPVNDMDSEWLGFKAEDEGLLQFKEPVDPNPKFKEAIKNGRLKDENDPEIIEILKRYSTQLSEWKSRIKYVEKLNTENDGKGIKVKRYGKFVITKVSIDKEGYLVFNFNGERVYKSSDGFHIIDAKTGKTIAKDKYDKIMSKLGMAYDAKRGNVINTAGIKSREAAERLINEYGSGYTRKSGEALLFVGGDATTKGYVDKISILDNGVKGSYEQLYGKVANLSYTGQPTP